MDGSLPRKPCRTCKNRFHAGCLYKVRGAPVLCFINSFFVSVVQHQPFFQLSFMSFGYYLEVAIEDVVHAVNANVVNIAL